MENDKEACADDNAVSDSGITRRDDATALAILSHLLDANTTRKLAEKYCPDVLNPKKDAAPHEDNSKQ